MEIFSELNLMSWFYLALGSILIGMAKNGVPGIGILVVPCVVAAFPTRQAMGVLLPMLIVGDCFAVFTYHRKTDWSVIKSLAIWVALGLLCAWYVLTLLNDEQLKQWLGAILIGLVILQFFKGHPAINRWVYHLTFTACIGFLIGFSSTVANLAGPIMGIYLVALKQEKTALVATSAVLFGLLNVAKVPVYILQDMVTLETLMVSLIAIPIIGTGAIAGVILHKHIPQKLFNRLIIAVAILAAVLLMISH